MADRKRHEFGTPVEKLRSFGNRMVNKRSLAKSGNKAKLLIMKGLAPQAGFEPATLRLTAADR
jgi:hypothetical protein